jgi:hypothetical protein
VDRAHRPTIPANADANHVGATTRPFRVQPFASSSATSASS